MGRKPFKTPEERFYRTLKFDHLYRLEIPNAAALTEVVDHYLEIYNRIRPHESLGQVPPMSRYLAQPNYPGQKLSKFLDAEQPRSSSPGPCRGKGGH